MFETEYELCEIQLRIRRRSRIPLIGRHEYIWQVIRIDSTNNGELMAEGGKSFYEVYSWDAIESHQHLKNLLTEQGWENYSERFVPNGVRIEQFKRKATR